jgi:hypothetical protein
MWNCHEELHMLDPNFPEFENDMKKLRAIGIVTGDSKNNSLTVKFIDQLTEQMIENKEDFYSYDITQPILNGIEKILLTYDITDSEKQRMTLIITGWINMMLKDGGFYDLN